MVGGSPSPQPAEGAGRDVGVVIVSWNVREALAECLGALEQEGSGRVGQVIVVDNASSDGTADRVAAEFPAVRLIRNASNRGFAAAANQGLRELRGDFCLLLNPDTRVIPGALATLAEFLEAHPAASAAGPCLLNPDGSLQPNGGPFPSLAATFLRATRLNRFGARWYDRAFRTGRRDVAAPARVDQVSGACLLIRRATLDQVGLLDEGYFLYYEEVDWLLRADRAGWETHYVPAARVAHRWGASTSQLPDAALRHLMESQYRFFARHRSAWLRPVAWLLTRGEWASHALARAFRGWRS